MHNAITSVPPPVNEPVLGFAPGSPERAAIDDELTRQLGTRVEVPLIIGGREVRTGNTMTAVVPHDHGHVLADVHLAGEKEIDAAVRAALDARRDWAAMPRETRAAVFLRASELLAGPWRMRVNAATMLNQSKTCHQAEIDASCELIDFFRFNCAYVDEIYAGLQPPVSGDGVWNMLECRPLEGFVYAVTPFNFTSIAANLPAAPALMGCTAVWKPSPSALYSNYVAMQLLLEAGLPPGVINFIPGDAEQITGKLLAHRDFAGLHFTGSTQVMKSLWRTMGDHIDGYRNYPRVVGETGGKDFVVAHPSAGAEALVVALLRGAYEFQGQKCSAASRAYVPRSLWDGSGGGGGAGAGVRDRLVGEIETIKMGDVADFSMFMGAVIHERSFDKCTRYAEAAKSSPDADVLVGGTGDKTKGYFFPPTLIEAKRPDYASMCEEIFGPVMTVFVYDDGDYDDVLRLCDTTSPYGLTGAIFARDRDAIDRAKDVLRYAAGNFYINDKPTGAVVGQQPFGGSRASGTNDKAGSPLNLLRWITPRTIKETLVPPTDWHYPFMG